MTPPGSRPFPWSEEPVNRCIHRYTPTRVRTKRTEDVEQRCERTGHAQSSRRDSASEAQGKSTRVQRALTQPWVQVPTSQEVPTGRP